MPLITTQLPPQSRPVDTDLLRPFLRPSSSGPRGKNDLVITKGLLQQWVRDGQWHEMWMLALLGKVPSSLLGEMHGVLRDILNAHRDAGLAWSAVLEHWPVWRPVGRPTPSQEKLERPGAETLAEWLEDQMAQTSDPADLRSWEPWRSSDHPVVRELVSTKLPPTWIDDNAWVSWLRGDPARTEAPHNLLTAVTSHPAETEAQRERLWTLTRPPEEVSRPWSLMAWAQPNDLTGRALLPNPEVTDALTTLARQGIPQAFAQTWTALLQAKPSANARTKPTEEGHQDLYRRLLMACPRRTASEVLSLVASVPPGNRLSWLQRALQHPAINSTVWPDLVELLPTNLQQQEVRRWAQQRTGDHGYVTNVLRVMDERDLHPPSGARHHILTALLGHPALRASDLVPLFGRLETWPDVVAQLAMRTRWRQAPALKAWWADRMAEADTVPNFERDSQWLMDPQTPLGTRQAALARLAAHRPSRVRRWVLAPQSDVASLMTQRLMATLMTQSLPTDSRTRVDLLTRLHEHWGEHLRTLALTAPQQSSEDPSAEALLSGPDTAEAPQSPKTPERPREGVPAPAPVRRR